MQIGMRVYWTSQYSQAIDIAITYYVNVFSNEFSFITNTAMK